MSDYSTFLASLENQLTELTNRCKILSDKKMSESLFDTYLFKPCKPGQLNSPWFIHYLEEIETNICYLKQKIRRHQPDQVIYLTDKITNQLIAMTREIATHNLRIHAINKTKETLYETHCRYIDYERLLIDIKRQFFDRAEKTTDMVKKTLLLEKIATLEGRIDRCRKAIAKLEDKISNDSVT